MQIRIFKSRKNKMRVRREKLFTKGRHIQCFSTTTDGRYRRDKTDKKLR